MANHNKDAELVEEKQALSMFFSSLLTDTEDTIPVQQQIDNELQVHDYKTDTDNTVFLPVIPLEVKEESIIPKADEVTNDVDQKTIIIEELSTPSDLRSIEGEFQIMMFKTAGLTLAVPLVELSGVITWPETITEMPGHKESYLGIVQHLKHKVPIIDIAQIVFPQDRIADIVDSDSSERLQRIVFINDFKWGLACDAVNDVITIDSKQIKWRKSGSQRAWLAGTVVEHMCALLDTNELSKLLNSDYS